MTAMLALCGNPFAIGQDGRKGIAHWAMLEGGSARVEACAAAEAGAGALALAVGGHGEGAGVAKLRRSG